MQGGAAFRQRHAEHIGGEGRARKENQDSCAQVQTKRHGVVRGRARGQNCRDSSVHNTRTATQWLTNDRTREGEEARHAHQPQGKKTPRRASQVTFCVIRFLPKQLRLMNCIVGICSALAHSETLATYCHSEHTATRRQTNRAHLIPHPHPTQ